MSQRVEVEIGHNIRAWTTFVVADATPEEAEVLGDLGSERAVTLLAELYKAGRAKEDGFHTDDDPAYFDPPAEADVIDFREED